MLRVGPVVLALACAGCVPAPPRTAPQSPAGTPVATRTPSSHAGPASPSASPPAPRRAAVRVPPVSAAARKAGLIDVRSIVPDAIVDLRYVTPINFTHVRLYPRDARCLVHRSMARGLIIAARRLRHQRLVLVFWDCYRPHAVQVRMYRIVPNPAWVAEPGPYAYSHEAARSVDVTLARPGTNCAPSLRIRQYCRLVMGTGFDDFTPRAFAFATTGVGPRARNNRGVLRHAMNAGGLSVYSGEWWHFDGSGSAVHRPILHVPVD